MTRPLNDPPRMGEGHRAQVLSALAGFGEGARTFYLAHKLGWSTGKTRYYLLALERAGKVERHPRYTAANDIFWRPSPDPLHPPV